MCLVRQACTEITGRAFDTNGNCFGEPDADVMPGVGIADKNILAYRPGLSEPLVDLANRKVR